jgi:cation transport regulator
MPYQKIDELPDSVRNSLDEHAQEIYRQAFNSAWEQSLDPEEPTDAAAREETAHRVAWAAVKQSNDNSAEDRRERRS